MPDEILHVVNWSGGLCSFFAAWRVKQRFGTSNLVLLFADTLIEDEDLYRFNDQASALIGVPITRLCAGLTPWELFRQRGLIGNSRFPICSIYLKRELLDGWHERHGRNRVQELQGSFWDDGKRPLIIYVGFDWSERHRLDAIRAEKAQWQWEAPMMDEPIWDKCRMQHEAEALGLTVSHLYKLGFPHDNCGGRCVRAGISHWVHLYHVLPERFADWEQEEQATRIDFINRGIEPLSILKDRRGGVTQNLWLADLRVRIDAGEKFDRFDWGGCGCGGATRDTVSREA